MSRLTRAIKLISKFMETIESRGAWFEDDSQAREYNTIHHIRRHYNVPADIYTDIINGDLRVK